VFPNIQRSNFHWVASRTPVLPCIETLGWIIDHDDTVKCTINNEQGIFFGVFLLTEVHSYYKLRDLEERINTNFMVKFYKIHDTNRFLALWWKEDRKFTNRSTIWYNTVNIRETYMYLMVLIYRLYRETYFSKFSEAWMPSSYAVAISGSSFNWGAIISK
jgi:hypothetical protein